MKTLVNIKEILKVLILIFLTLGLIFIGYEQYNLKKKENVLVRAFAKDCIKELKGKNNYLVFEISDLIDEVKTPENIKTKVIYQCGKEIYENEKGK